MCKQINGDPPSSSSIASHYSGVSNWPKDCQSVQQLSIIFNISSVNTKSQVVSKPRYKASQMPNYTWVSPKSFGGSTLSSTKQVTGMWRLLRMDSLAGFVRIQEAFVLKTEGVDELNRVTMSLSKACMYAQLTAIESSHYSSLYAAGSPKGLLLTPLLNSSSMNLCLFNATFQSAYDSLVFTQRDCLCLFLAFSPVLDLDTDVIDIKTASRARKALPARICVFLDALNEFPALSWIHDLDTRRKLPARNLYLIWLDLNFASTFLLRQNPEGYSFVHEFLHLLHTNIVVVLHSNHAYNKLNVRVSGEILGRAICLDRLSKPKVFD
ncbi:hypothetical protein KCV06_g681, partial [Aureobasidium melanogenum]